MRFHPKAALLLVTSSELPPGTSVPKLAVGGSPGLFPRFCCCELQRANRLSWSDKLWSQRMSHLLKSWLRGGW